MKTETPQPRFYSYQRGCEWYGEEGWTAGAALDMCLENREGNEPFRLYCRDEYGNVSDITEDTVAKRNRHIDIPIFMSDDEEIRFDRDASEAADEWEDNIRAERRIVRGGIA